VKGAYKALGAAFVIIVLLYIYSSIAEQWAAMESDLRLALTMIFFVWILNWARKNLGSPRLAIVYALVIAYIIFYKHPQVVWWIVGLFVLSIIGPKFFGKLGTGGPGKDPWLDTLKGSKPTVYMAMPPAMPGYPYIVYPINQPPQQGKGDDNKR